MSRLDYLPKNVFEGVLFYEIAVVHLDYRPDEFVRHVIVIHSEKEFVVVVCIDDETPDEFDFGNCLLCGYREYIVGSREE